MPLFQKPLLAILGDGGNSNHAFCQYLVRDLQKIDNMQKIENMQNVGFNFQCFKCGMVSSCNNQT